MSLNSKHWNKINIIKEKTNSSLFIIVSSLKGNQNSDTPSLLMKHQKQILRVRKLRNSVLFPFIILQSVANSFT